MKIRNGVNPDYADFDEIDQDVEDAYEEFDAGNLTYEELKNLVGPAAAASYAENYRDEVEDLFDDPENF